MHFFCPAVLVFVQFPSLLRRRRRHMQSAVVPFPPRSSFRSVTMGESFPEARFKKPYSVRNRRHFFHVQLTSGSSFHGHFFDLLYAINLDKNGRIFKSVSPVFASSAHKLQFLFHICKNTLYCRNAYSKVRSYKSGLFFLKKKSYSACHCAGSVPWES